MYEFPEDFCLDRSNQIIGVSDITYGENPLTEWFIDNIPDQIEDDFYEHFTTELLKKVLIIKAVGWSYEQECRIIREKAGPLSIPKEYLRQVCFGMNIPESDMHLIKKIVDGSGYTVNYCQIMKKETDFGIKAVEI